MTEAELVTAQQVNVFDVLFERVKFGDVLQWRELGVVSRVQGFSKPTPDDQIVITVRVGDWQKSYTYPAAYPLAVIRGEKWK